MSKFLYSYLNQVVSLKGITSPSLEITSGVPQGSILGPILFLIYLNDLFRVSNKLKLIMFADDTNAFLSHNSLDVLFDIMNSELFKIVEWFNINKLSLNSDKTNYILFRTPENALKCVGGWGSAPDPAGELTTFPKSSNRERKSLPS